VAARRVRSSDGREWTVRVRRVRLPSWRHSSYEPELSVAEFVVAPIFWFVVPLLSAIVELPIALVRPLFSRVRWVEAECRWPSEIRIVWRTSRAQAEATADHVAARLPHGYGGLTPVGAELVSMTRPPGLDDLDT
jgi:hypothetical protein